MIRERQAQLEQLAPIGPRLPRVAPAALEPLNRLWRLPENADAGLSLKPISSWPRRGWLALDMAGTRLTVRFCDLFETEPWDRFDSGLSKAFWLEASLARHASAIEELERALGYRAEAFELADSPVAGAGALPLLALSLAGQSEPLALVQFDFALLVSLVADGRARLLGSGLDRQRLVQADVACRLLLQGRPVPAGRLQALARGDVFVVGWRHALDRGLRLECPNSRWRLDARPDGSMVIRAREELLLTQEQQMESNNKDVSGSGADDSQPAAESGDKAATKGASGVESQLDQIPLQVEFEIGRLKLSLAELARLKPGYVFPLPAPVEGSNVVIRIQGKRMGTGQIVAIGEYLGVRVQGWSGDGSGDD